MQLLCGDIGGTKTRLAYCTVEDNHIILRHEEQLPSRQFVSLEALIATYLLHHPLNLDSACFGVAGPVQNGNAQITNLPWTVDSSQLKQHFSWQCVSLLNDIEAIAWGIPALQPADFCILHQGRTNAQGNAAVIAPGTGLGEAAIFRPDNDWLPFACEGGHCDFSPADRLEFDLQQQLSGGKFPVSWERLVSGPGLVVIHDFLRARHPAAMPWQLRQALRDGDPAATISSAALEHRDPVCQEALELFVNMMGREAANLALKVMATGGVYIGGGIGPKILPALQAPEFLEAFLKKGPMTGLLAKIPLSLILNDRAALYGAALYRSHDKHTA